MALMPEYQKQIEAACKELNIDEERAAMLQPILESQIQIHGEKDDTGNMKSYSAVAVDDDGKIREGISIADVVKEVNGKTAGHVPVLPAGTNPSAEQLQQIADGKLTIATADKQKFDPDAIKGSDALTERPNLEDVASGKVKFNIGS